MKRLVTFFSLMGLSTALLAAEVCEKVVISGQPNWPPFSVRQGDELNGLGVELVSEIFQGLDLPVEIRSVDKPVILEKLLREGSVDILVASYNNPDKNGYLHFIEPAYYTDAVAVLVPNKHLFEMKEWNDLMGKTGLSLLNNDLGFQFEQFANKYLFVEPKPTLPAIFKVLETEHADYFVGSKSLIEYLLQDPEKAQNFTVLQPDISSEPLFVAMSKRSKCQIYASYLQSQLRNRVEGKVIASMLKRTMQTLNPQPVVLPDAPVTAPEAAAVAQPEGVAPAVSAPAAVTAPIVPTAVVPAK